MIIGEKELSRLPAHLQCLFEKLPNHGKDEVVGCFPDSAGQNGLVDGQTSSNEVYGARGARPRHEPRNDSGSAARFFYSAKADSDDRLGSKHPTVKPVDLMQWLVRMVTPPGGTVLDPFAGTGTTGEAAWREGFNAVLIEREAEYRADVARRMELCNAGATTRRHESVKAKGTAKGAGPLFGDNA